MPDPAKNGLTDGEIIRLLREIEKSPAVTQRGLSSRLDISLGKVNYSIRTLMDQGLVTRGSFKKNNNKQVCLYTITPHGLKEKAKITSRFLKERMREYERLGEEIEQLKREVRK